MKEYLPDPKYPLLFKAVVPVAQDAPEWVHIMYSSNPNIFEIEKAYEKYYSKHDFVKTIHTQNYKHLVKKIFQNNWYQENGTIEIKELPENNQLQKLNSTQDANWLPIGPFNTFNNGGTKTESHQVNVYTLAQSLSNPMIMLCGTETDAVFKSTDKGENWVPVGENIFNDGIVSVEIDPTNPNIFFVGTTNRIYKSADGGVSWTQVLNVSNLSIYEFAIHPGNNQLIFAAGNKGLYKSTDGGSNWSPIYSDNCRDIKFKTNDPQTVFLLKDNPALKVTEFYKSIDGGNTFILKNNGWFVPTATSSIGGARMGITNADGNRIYVALLGNVDNYATDVNFIGLYRSDDAGENWYLPYDQNNDGIANNNPGGPYSSNHWCFSCFNTNGGDYDQGFYNLAIDVSDTDPDKFLMGMLNLFKSENGGKTYTPWGGYSCTGCTSYYRHPDHQDILVNGNDVFVATDGGIDLYDPNLNIIKAINKGINGSDNWGFGQGWNEDIITSGRYHNGNAIYHANYSDGKFISLGGGEAPTGYINLGDHFKSYYSDISGKKATADFTTLVTNTPNPSLFPNEAYYTSNKSELVYDPRYYNHMYLGKDNKLWKSENGGSSFSLIKSFGTVSTDLVTGIEVSRQNPDIIFVAQREGSVSRLWRSQDAGANWTSIPLPSSQVTMYISLDENNVLFIAYGSGANKVYKSNDLGNTWINLTTSTISSQGISGVLAQMGTNDGVYVMMSGSNRIYYRNSTHTDWQLFNQGLPINNRFMSMLPFYKNGQLRISGTRGFWRSPLFETSLPVAQPMVATKTVDCHRTQVQFDDHSVLNHSGATWSWSFPGAATVSSTSVRNPLVTYTTPGLYSVTLTVTDGNGNTSSKTVPNMIEVIPSTCSVENQALNVLEMVNSSQAVTSDNLTYGTTSNLTFTGWIKPNGIQNQYTAIICFGDEKTNTINFRSNNEIGFHSNGNHWGVSTGLYANENQWNYIAYRITPTQITIFLNDKKWTFNGNFASFNLNKLILGKYYNWNDRTFKGQMEEFTVWNRALTDDEIYLGRHLIKQNISDPNMVGYYQFNNVQNSGKVYDKVNTNDLTVSGDITFPASTAPIGIGTSQMLSVMNAGNYNFINSFANLNFSSTVPNGKVVVSKLLVAPHNKPATGNVANEYWILNNYGTNLTFSGLTSVELQSSASLSGNLKIYKRNSNGYLQQDWIQDAGSTFVSSNTAQFPGSGLNQSYQWFMGSESTLHSDEPTQPSSSIVLYPNPYKQGDQLTVQGINEDFKFNLYDTSGKLIVSKKLQTNTITIQNNLPKGVYIYRIETNTKIYNGKLLVE